MTQQLTIEDIQRLDDYQIEALRTAIFPKHLGVLYTVSGSIGEAGESGAVLLEVLNRAQREDPKFETPDLLMMKAAISAAVAACNVVEMLKKKARKGLLNINPLPKLLPAEVERFQSEGGDGLWYGAGTADEIGRKLTDVAQGNIRKLRERRETGTIVAQGETVAERQASIKAS